MNARTGHLDKQKELAHLNPKLRRAILGGVTFCSLVLALMCITQPFNPLSQFIFLMLLWGVALLVRRIPGRFSALMLIVLSLTVSCRYIWWRYTSTLNWNDPVSLVCGIILLFAETYAWVVLVLGYFQVVWPLNRQPVPLPEDMDLWPTVDIFVPTYNEDLNVVKNTIYASQGIDWPKDKLNIWILDDGGREAFRQFAKDVGVHYIARTSHEHAKAGNINNALKYAKGEFVSIFDCDHVPTRSFLQMTMGWFLKEKELAMMQTPHHFFSPDPLSATLVVFAKRRTKGRYSTAGAGRERHVGRHLLLRLLRRYPPRPAGRNWRDSRRNGDRRCPHLAASAPAGIYLRLYAYSAGGGAGDGEFIRAYRPAHPLGARDGADIPPR